MYIPKVQSATGGVCPEQRAAAVRALLQERPSQFSPFPRREECGVAFNSHGKLPSASPGTQCQVTAPVPPAWCFCCSGSRGPRGRWMLLNVHIPDSVPPQIRVINPPMCRTVNKAAHYSERENQQYEKAVPYVTTEITLTYCPRGCIAV